MSVPSDNTHNLLWINKTAESASLSHCSDSSERIRVLSQAQRISRLRTCRINSKRNPRAKKSGQPDTDFDKNTTCTIVAEQRLTCNHDWTSEERRGVHYFLIVTTRKIISLERDSMFWRDTLPHLVQSHTAFRHLVVAIATTHELLSDPDASRLNVVALRHCSKATRLLLDATNLDLSLLLASCILVSAYHLLRGDITSADKSIESGTRMGERVSGTFASGLQRMLARLGKLHGFKLWAPDVVSRFDKSALTAEPLVLEVEDCVESPCTDIAELLAKFKRLSLETAGIGRNVAGGAYVDPECAFAKEISRQMGLFAYYWDQYLIEHPEERLELLQIRIAFDNMYCMFHAKLIGAGDLRFDAFLPTYERILLLAEEVITARHAGRNVVYIDKFVNGALFSLGMFCRHPGLRRRAIALLQSQSMYEESLLNFLRGTIIEMIMSVEGRRLTVRNCNDIPLHRRIYMWGMRCREEDKAVCLTFGRTNIAWGSNDEELMNDWADWETLTRNGPPEIRSLAASEINECFQGILSTCRMYNKARVEDAPRGYVRPMYFRGEQVPILWEPGRNPNIEHAQRANK